jgi:hypothetical protein
MCAVHVTVGEPLRLAHRPVQGITAILVLIERQADRLQESKWIDDSSISGGGGRTAC